MSTATTLSRPPRDASKPDATRNSLTPSGRGQAVARRSPKAARRRFPIVGIGASAGGLEAFTQLLQELPLNTGFGFVLVQHLDPQHASGLTQLLARTTAMPVLEVTDRLRVKANHVYIIPPNTRLGIERGVLKLHPRAQNRVAARSIDSFFESLAADQGERAIGVILSGTATDGTLGLEAIKTAGGLTFAQDNSARYPSMPRSAADAGCVDQVLPPAAIARELARIARHPALAGTDLAFPAATARAVAQRGRAATARHRPANDPATHDNPGYERILQQLRQHCGVDFTLYKSPTIQRRIARRAVLSHMDTLGAYADFLVGNGKEIEALYSDTLISVTSFFRNADAFAVLSRKVFPRLLQQNHDDPLRMWVLGCSTGQEAYSLAMAFTEVAEKSVRPRTLQVFATDLNDTNLEKCRQGLYAKTHLQDVSPRRLRRFFVEEEGGYRVIKPLRELVVFARQNIISDPPFSRMDLISCRNLMIYLEPSLQRKALPTFHYALKPGGYLFLGASESIGTFTNLFEPVDKKQKIFVRKAAPTLPFQLPVKADTAGHPAPGKAPRALSVRDATSGRTTDAYRGELDPQREADRLMVGQFAPPGVLINADLQILQFRGQTGAYLVPPTGKASFDLLKMARDGLLLPLRAAITKAKKENKTARRENIPVKLEGRIQHVAIQVVPLKNLRERCFLVWFETTTKAGRAAPAAYPPPDAEADVRTAHAGTKHAVSRRILQLERELTETRDYLRSIEEEQESANEELQAANEEGQSANEELQSLNEELETSKEELESTNEELTTVNEEMTNRNTELGRLNNDLTNLQTSTQLVIVLLGRDLTIRRFSAQAEKQFGLMATDVGRPIGHLRHNLQVPDIESLITGVITHVRQFERDVRDKDGRWYSLRVRPYLTPDNRVDGAVLVLVDISALKRTEQVVKEEHEHAEAIIRTVPNPLVILSADLKFQSANDAFYRTFKLTTAETRGRSLFALDHGSWNIPTLRHLLEDVIPRRSYFNDFEFSHQFERIGQRSLLLNARVLNEYGGKPRTILLGFHDVTDLLVYQAELRRSERRYRRLFEAAKDGFLILDPDTRKITDANPFIVRLLGYSRPQLLKKELWEIGLLKDEAAGLAVFRALKRRGFIRYENLPLKTKSGKRLEVEFVSNLYRENNHQVIQCNIRDITERKRFDEALRLSEERYRTLFASMDEGFSVIEMLPSKGGKPADYRFIEVNPSFEKQTGIAAATGRRMSEIAPHHESHWYKVYAQVARTGRPVRFINEAKALGRWFDVFAFRLGPAEHRHVAVLFRDITTLRNADAALRTAQAQLSDRANQLEHAVADRTAKLTATNRELATSLAAIRKSEERYRTMLAESHSMQKKLRKLTHQIISVQEDERKEISRELHDEVVQTLVGINVELAALNRGSAVGLHLEKSKIAHAQRLVENSVHAVHRFARELRPAVLDDLGLIPALHAFSQTLAERKKLKIKLTAFAGVETLGGPARTVLFRVAQEALNNVARHARASNVRIEIREHAGRVRMEISDDGQAFHVGKFLDARNPKRLGLVGMKERIQMIGGTLTIHSQAGTGTTVQADIPFKSKKPTP
ncbi:chemotaxis protein CheB [Horticoccus sp. 23ND18S-11]|uniref:chemotaxis protein CheB n=1 Tax=Horticoccus sp. 23ND18S-11 TaxID=3391832 RepID=UPI0039C8E9AD